MEIIKSIVIGGIQGISEFLPVSSSGHLVIIPYLLRWNYNGLSFDIALHFGTVIALLAYFFKDWLKIIKNAFKKPAGEDSVYPRNLLWQIILATIPAAIVGVIGNDYIDRTFHSSTPLGMVIIAINLAVWGVLLWFVDKKAKQNLEIKKIGWGQSFFVGIAQAVALMPGVSRSGITITASRSLGLDREEAARFSFLLATPAMVGAFLLKFKDISANDLNPIFIAGVISSTVFSFLAIRFLLSYLKRSNFNVFVWYRIIIALVVLGIFLAR